MIFKKYLLIFTLISSSWAVSNAQDFNLSATGYDRQVELKLNFRNDH